VTGPISAAEKNGDQVASIATGSNDYESYEVQIDFLTKLVRETIGAHVRAKRHLLRIRVKTPVGKERHQLVCYGQEEVARVHMSVQSD